jgi:glutaredoxin-dependent peroxiredoxin
MKLFHRVEPFELLLSDGSTTTIRDYTGRYVVLYFYPKANTSGCTREAQELTERLGELRALDAEVIGVSPDSLAALCRFRESKELGVTLASDPERALARQLGALKPDGKSILRSTFLIDRRGVLRQQWRGVKVEGHAEEVLDVVRALNHADRQLDPSIAVRRSYRALDKRPIDEADLRRLVEAAHLAPSCYNHQPWRMIVATGSELEALKATLPKGNAWALASPAIVTFVAAREDDCQSGGDRDYYLFDCGLAAENLMLQATRIGLVAHPIAGFSPEKTRALFSIPERYTVVVLIVLGAPGDPGGLEDWAREVELGPRQRRPLDEVVGWNEFVDGAEK